MKNTMRRLTATISVLGLLAGCAGAPHENPADATPMAAPTADEQTYLQYAGPPIDSFSYLTHFEGFKVLGPASLVLWTHYDTAYLLMVRQPCPELSVVDGLDVTSSTRTVSKNFDYVVLDHDRCQIETIRRLDFAAMKAAHLAGP